MAALFLVRALAHRDGRERFRALTGSPAGLRGNGRRRNLWDMEREVFESREVELAGGQHIVARIFRPAGARRGAVLIVAAMGVTQAFYAPLAKWLAGEGYLALTFDYRGMGLSRPPEHRRSLRGFDVGLLDWAREDCAAMVELALLEAPGGRALLARAQPRRPDPAVRSEPRVGRPDDHRRQRQRLLA